MSLGEHYPSLLPLGSQGQLPAAPPSFGRTWGKDVAATKWKEALARSDLFVLG